MDAQPSSQNEPLQIVPRPQSVFVAQASLQLPATQVSPPSPRLYSQQAKSDAQLGVQYPPALQRWNVLHWLWSRQPSRHVPMEL